MSTDEKATFGAGCFWGVEEIFRTTKGVLETAVGYEGGSTINPTYEDVCYKETNHAEVIELVFDSSIITYNQLLEVFWKCHNPTTLNRQGPDVGSQYRSVIYFHNSEQETLAIESKSQLDGSGDLNEPVVTEISSKSTFYKAEEYHQKYFMKNGGGGCHI
ncbi:MAG: peptide-methionine (S)-S-oxide reductase [Planctomycetota bacterium]|nr:MAG: peptide-methionine (S)-S-oxide reductase [Planctomycetota bacterium]